MNQQHELSKAAAARLERMERWMEDHEERLDRLEVQVRRIDSLLKSIISEALLPGLVVKDHDLSDAAGVHPTY